MFADGIGDWAHIPQERGGASGCTQLGARVDDVGI